MLAARHFLVSGRVQGVGFRMFVHDAAYFEHVSGWVRNLPDGRVEALAEGSPGALDRFEARLRLGPPRSQIDVVEATGRPHTGEFTRFRIERD